jgi:prepilin-type N-terminal cleavage/methylation domain-containing protein/prepilin-type processing-associated H-X9-DG protein
MCESKKQKAFTLVEVLVVISIISLLMAILMPALSEARKQAQKVVCASNLRNIGFGFEIYVDNNEGWLPAAEPKNKGDVSSRENWYLNDELIKCMNIEPQLDASGKIIGPPAERSLLTCPTHQNPTMSRAETELFPAEDRGYAISYMMNGTLKLSNRGGVEGKYRHISEFRKPAETFILCDGNGFSSARGIVFYEACPKENFEFRHKEKINVLFFDKHIGTIAEEEIPLGRENCKENFWNERKEVTASIK